MTHLDRVLKAKDITLLTKVHIAKAMVFPVVVYGCESWTIKKAEHWRIDAFELWWWRRLLRVPWIARRSNQSILKDWLFFGGTDAEAPVLWPPDTKSQFIGKDPDAGKDRGQEEKEATEDEMVGWHHQPKEYEFEHILGNSEGLGSLACCSPWGPKGSETTGWPNSKVTECAQLSLFRHVLLFATPSTVAHQAPVSIEFSRQEYLSGLLSPTFWKL